MRAPSAGADAGVDGAATEAAAVGAATVGAVVAPPPLEHAESAIAAPPMRATRRPADVCFKCDSSNCLDGCLLTTCDRWRRRWPTSADAVDGRLGLVGKGRDDDREDQQQPEGDALDLDRHAGEP